MKKIILANCPINNGNRGCVALSISTMYLLKQILNEKNITYEFYLPQSYFSDFGKKILTIDDDTYEFYAIPDFSNITIKHIIKELYLYKYYKNTMQIYKTADFILDIGQGDSFTDIYGEGRFNRINGSYKLGRKYHRPYCILPQTIGPFKDGRIRQKAVKSLSNADMVLVRDKQSYDYVHEIAPGQGNLKEIMDVAFFMPYQKKTFNKSFIHVGLNVSALLWNGGYTRGNQFELKVDYQSLVRQIINFFMRQKDVKLHLIPHVVSGERHIENDYAVSYDLCEEYKDERLILAPLFFDPITAKSYIAGMDFFMGARMHATIGAFSSGVPVYPMAYSRKFNGLFVDTLKYDAMGDMKTQDNVSIMSGIEEAYENRTELKHIIDDRMNGVVTERREILIHQLSKFMNLQ